MDATVRRQPDVSANPGDGLRVTAEAGCDAPGPDGALAEALRRLVEFVGPSVASACQAAEMARRAVEEVRELAERVRSDAERAKAAAEEARHYLTEVRAVTSEQEWACEEVRRSEARVRSAVRHSAAGHTGAKPSW